ncbi:amidohydrolase family protein [Streptomyces xanthochromogenes]|uniref:amidohydrolase family protein n=1 Tax=Streptomyces xanthochromogenes TaxID=67384 RepID=UPI00343352A6
MSDHVGRRAAARTAGAARVNGSDGSGGGGDGGDGGDGESEGGSGDGGLAVRAFWGRLGVPGLVDVHTHFMPERVLKKVWEYFDSAGELVGGVEWPITYREDEAERVRLLRAEFGVLAFTSMIYPHKAGMAEWLNGWSVGFAARTPGCLHTSTFFPEPGAAGYVRDALDAGARIFKSHVQVGGYDPGDPLLDPVWGLLAEAEVPVVIHCGSGPAPGKFTGPGPVGRVLARHPRLRLVVAHMGMPEYADFLGLAETYGEVMLDTTMAFTDFSERSAPFPAGELGRLRDLGDRVLFGSDFPNIPYPYLHQLEALERLGLGDEWLRAVCHDNAARLFGLPVRRPLPHPGPLPG